MTRGPRGVLSLAILALAASLTASQACCAEPPAGGADVSAPVDLGPKFDAEPVTTYEHVTQIVQQRSVQRAREERLTADLTRRFTMRLLEVREDGGATVAMAFKRIRLVVTPPDGAGFDFDSQRPDAQNPTGPRSAMLRRMMGLAVRIRLDKNGQFVAVENESELEAALGVGKDRTDLAPMFDKASIKETAEEVWGFAGDPTVRKLGDQWTRESRTEVGGQTNVPIKLNCTLSALKDGIASITGKGEFAVGQLRPLVEGLATTVKEQMLMFDVQWNVPLGRVEGFRTAQTLALSQGIPEIPISAVFVSNAELKRVADGE